jgi:multidrug efflux system outer membrane protein
MFSLPHGRASAGLIVCLGLFAAGCAVGPNYKRPAVPAPPQFRGGENPPSQASLGDTKWFDLFQDDTLRGLINEALKANYDIQIAAQRVIAAQGQLAATRSALFPELHGQATASRSGLNRPIVSTASGGGARAAVRRRGRSTCSAESAARRKPPAPICWPSKRIRKP